jgi:hypothetical protein
MMECGLPVTGLEFQSLKKTLASLPRTTPEDLTSAVFLKYSGLPLTGENITTLASFIRNRPLLGSQVLELQQALRNLLNNGKPELSPQMFNTLERLRELLDGFMLDPGRGSRRELSDSLFRTAGRSLVEKPTGGGNGDETSLASLREQLGRGADLQEGTTLAAVFKLLGELGKNLSAQGLLNQARDGDNPGFFYFQVPLRLDDEGRTGELRVRYRRDSEESRRVDPDDARVEFTVETEHLGKLEYMMEMTRGRLGVQVGVASREKKDFVQNRLHFLKDRLESLGCEPGLMVCRVNAAPVKREGIPVKIFESSERVNVTA